MARLRRLRSETLYLGLAALLAVGPLSLGGCRDGGGRRPPLRYCVGRTANSYDPYYGFISSVGEITQNLYAPLVSTALGGEPQGLVAQDWTVDESGRVWRFRIREGLTFDDGSPVTAEAVLKNLRRMIWLTKKEGLVLNSLLPDVGRWRSCGAPLAGLSAEGGAIVFRFSRRPGNLFETLGQAVYGIANPKCFDALGHWKEGCASGCGQYRLKERSAGRVILQSRHLYPEVRDAPDTVEVQVVDFTRVDLPAAFLTGGCSLACRVRQAVSRTTQHGLAAKGLAMTEAPPVGICTLQLAGDRPPFGDRALRQSLRDVFLNLLRQDPDFSSEIEVDPSFLPRGAMGYMPLAVPARPRPAPSPGGRVRVYCRVPASHAAPADRKTMEAVERALLEALRRHGLRPEKVRRRMTQVHSLDCEAELGIFGVFVKDPYADLRRMFMNSIGLFFPFSKGPITRLIERGEATSDPAERRRIAETINASIFEDALLIPYAHTWLVYIHVPGVDMSRFDLFLDPIEFRAVGWSPKKNP